MEISTKEVAGITFVYFEGQLISTTAGKASDELVSLVRGGSRKIILNLRGLSFISSAGLRSILVASKLLRTSSGELRICEVNDTVRQVLETSGFNSLVQIHTDESEALAAFH
jgi:anti-anti-sigma factor